MRIGMKKGPGKGESHRACSDQRIGQDGQAAPQQQTTAGASVA